MEVIPQEVFKVREECKVHQNWSDLATHHVNKEYGISITVCRDCGFVLRSVPYEERVNA
jgi:hypothetical protein